MLTSYIIYSCSAIYLSLIYVHDAGCAMFIHPAAQQTSQSRFVLLKLVHPCSGVKTRERWIDCLRDPLVPPWGYGHPLWACKDWHSAGHVGMCEENRTWTPCLSESQGCWGATFAECLDGTDQHQGRRQFCPRNGVKQWPIRHHGSRRETCEKPDGEVPCARRGCGFSLYSRPRAPDKGSHLWRCTEVCGAEEYIVGSDIFLRILWANLRGENGDDLANCSTCRWWQMKDIGVYMLPAVDGRGRGNGVKRCNLHLEKGFQLYMNFFYLCFMWTGYMRNRKSECNYCFGSLLCTICMQWLFHSNGEN